MSRPVDFTPLLAYLRRIPAIDPIAPDGTDSNQDGAWLVKFRIDIGHPGAWKAVMDLGYVVKPVSAPPDMNGDDPRQLLWWLIQCWTPSFTPADLAQALEVSLFGYPSAMPDVIK